MGRCLFIPSVCLWLLPQPLDLAVASIFLLLKSLYPTQWPWPGPKRTPHWTSFHTATPAPQETHTPHVARPTLPQQSLACCHRLPLLSQTRELCVPSGFSLIHLTRLEGKAMDTCPPHTPLPGGRAAGDSQHSSSSLQEIPLPILPTPTPFNIFPLAEGSKRHGASLQTLPWNSALGDQVPHQNRLHLGA